MNPDFSIPSCVDLLSNLSIAQNRLSAEVEDKVYSSSFSGWIPLHNMLYKNNWPSSLNSLILEGFPFQNLKKKVDYYHSTQPFTNFNLNFKNHNNLTTFKYVFSASGESTTIYTLPGVVFSEQKVLFMVCLSEKLCIDIFRELTDRVNKRDEVKIFMDYELMTPRYQKVYKLLESLYILPMLERGVEMSIQPSESFLKEVLGNELDIPVFNPEEIQEFQRVLKEEIL